MNTTYLHFLKTTRSGRSSATQSCRSNSPCIPHHDYSSFQLKLFHFNCQQSFIYISTSFRVKFKSKFPKRRETLKCQKRVRIEKLKSQFKLLSWFRWWKISKFVRHNAQKFFCATNWCKFFTVIDTCDIWHYYGFIKREYSNNRNSINVCIAWKESIWGASRNNRKQIWAFAVKHIQYHLIWYLLQMGLGRMIVVECFR